MNYYLEYIFIENYIINFFLLQNINIFTKSKIKITRIIISSVISTIYSLIFFKYDLNSIFLKLLLINVVIYISFKPSNIKKYFKLIAYYFFEYYLYVGIIIGITLFFRLNADILIIKVLVYISSAVLLYLLNSLMWKMWKTNIKKENLSYTINIEGQEINCFVDTGNIVKNIEYNLDIIFLDKMWYELLKKKNVLNNRVDTHIHSILKDSIIPGYVITNVEVYRNNKKINTIKKIIISFSEQSINIDNIYTGIIGYNTYVEKLEGVKL